LIDKSESYPLTLADKYPWKRVEHGDFDKLGDIPPGKWVFISYYGIEKKQQLDEKGQVNLALLDRFQDDELFMFSCIVPLRDADLIKLSRFKSLRGLSFGIEDGFTDARILSRFKDLERLIIYDLNPPYQNFWKAKEAAATLGAMSKLRSLTLYSSFCDDDTMQIIEKLTNLESLWLLHSNLSDRGLQSIQTLTSLREIGFKSPLNGSSGITDEGIAVFAKLKKLESLFIEAPNVSDEAIEALKARFPNAKIRVYNKKSPVVKQASETLKEKAEPNKLLNANKK